MTDDALVKRAKSIRSELFNLGDSLSLLIHQHSDDRAAVQDLRNARSALKKVRMRMDNLIPSNPMFEQITKRPQEPCGKQGSAE